MKKLCSIGLVLALLLTAALAGADGVVENDALPADVAAAFAGPEWTGYTPIAVDAMTAAGNPDTIAVVAMRSGERNILCILDKVDGQYTIGEMSVTALHQGDRTPVIGELYIDQDGAGADGLSYSYDDTTVKESFHAVRATDLSNSFVGYHWFMQNTQYADGLDAGHTMLYPMRIDYFVDSSDGYSVVDGSQVTEYGLYYRDVACFDINAHGHHPGDMKPESLTVPTRVTAGEQLDPLPEAVPALLAVDTPVDVYTGFAPHFIQTEGAQLDQYTDVRAISKYGNMLLVAYTNGDEDTRYGYAPLSALDIPEDIPEAKFMFLKAKTTVDAPITDAPDSGATFGTLPAGSDVEYLATLGSDWSYIKVNDALDAPAFGFVKSDQLSIRYNLEADESPAIYATVSRDVEMIDEPYRVANPNLLATLEAGSEIGYIDNLFGEWGYVTIERDGQTIFGFVPRDAVQSEHALQGNG